MTQIRACEKFAGFHRFRCCGAFSSLIHQKGNHADQGRKTAVSGGLHVLAAALLLWTLALSRSVSPVSSFLLEVEDP